jgi:hypothetical protein
MIYLIRFSASGYRKMTRISNRTTQNGNIVKLEHHILLDRRYFFKTAYCHVRVESLYSHFIRHYHGGFGQTDASGLAGLFQTIDKPWKYA